MIAKECSTTLGESDQMINTAMEVEFSRQNFEATATPLIRIQGKCHGIPAIKIFHHQEMNEELIMSTSLPTSNTTNSTLLPCMYPRREQSKEAQVTSNAESCARAISHARTRMSRDCQCVSLMLPLEDELNVLGVVEQGVIDCGQHAKLKRNENVRKRNYSVPNLLYPISPVQRQRPRSFSSDSGKERTKRMMEILHGNSSPSTILCSTEL